MKRTATALTVLAAVAAVAAVAVLPVRPASAMTAPSPHVPSATGPSLATEACATTGTGRRIACVTVHHDGDRRSEARLCTYDDALGIFGWSRDAEVACVDVEEGWGFVEGPATCVRLLGSDRPATCANGEAGCLLWVAGVRVVCHTS